MLVIFAMQSLECRGFTESSVKAFRDMAPLCPAMQRFLAAFHELLAAEIADVLQSATPAEMRDKMAARRLCGGSEAAAARLSPLCLLTDAELERMRDRFVYVAAGRCGDGAGSSAAFEAAVRKSSHRTCTKDGIHFRSRFVKIRVDVLLNAIAAWMDAMSASLSSV